MRTRFLPLCLVLVPAFTALLLLSRPAPVHGAGAAPIAWDAQAAAHYLDNREVWWQAWPRAQKDHGTVCISCHTQVPYALARPLLQRQLHETAARAPDAAMLASVEKRVANWPAMETFYTDAKSGPGKTVESRATEAVLNAVILASVDAPAGHLRPITRSAFNHAWALQQVSGNLNGAWIWQNFHLGPWEGDESGYQGAALLLIAALDAPNHYAAEPDIQPHIDRLRAFLQHNYAAQPALNQLYVLWASSRQPALLTPSQRAMLLANLQAQQRPDGGWRTSALDDRPRVDHSPAPTASDGYATALAVLALETSGTTRRDPTLQRGLAWLTQHQQDNGAWLADSVNKKRAADSDPSLFMTDAATAYAVLALDSAH